LTGLLVFLGCFAGASLGDSLTFPVIGTAVLYPPYAILTAALVWSPPRQWWIYLLACTAGSFGPHYIAGAPPSFVLLTELANYARALIAAVAIREFCIKRLWRESLRGMAIFLTFAAVVAPLVAALMGAAFVAWHTGVAQYWPAVQAWWLSNALTALTLLPVLLGPFTYARPKSANVFEAVVLSISVFAVGAWVHLGSNPAITATPAALYASLPLLMWAAVRFGVRGTAAVLLAVTLIAIVGTERGLGPFVAGAPAEQLLHLQTFLFMSSVPLLLLAAAIQDTTIVSKALFDSKRQYRAVVEDQMEFVCRFRSDGALTFANHAFIESLGGGSGDADGLDFWSRVPADQHDMRRVELALLTPDQPLATWEHETPTGDGTTTRWEQWRVRALFDEFGAVSGYHASGRNITDRKLAEANAKFRGFFEQGSIFAGIMDINGTLLEVNRAGWEGCGYAKEQVTGIPIWEGPWFAPIQLQFAPMIKAACAQAAAGHTYRGEMPYYVADGGQRYVDFTLQPVKDDTGRVLFLAGTGADVTARRQAEADRERFVRLIENSTDFIGMAELDGRPFFINRAGLALIGLDSLEDARRTLLRDFFFPEDVDRIEREVVPRILETGHGEVEARFRNFKTGNGRWMSHKVLALKDSAGQPFGFATVSQDITERRGLERDLRRVAADLEEAARRKDEFLAILAHELRNPLAPLSNMIEVMKRAGENHELIRYARDMMDRQLGQLVRLVDDLLDANRISHNRLQLRRSRIELSDLVQQALEGSRPLADAATHELVVALPREPIYLDGDPVRLAQAFGNLINNSCKYTNRGGVIRVTVTREGHEGVVSIKDTGVGLAAHELERIFEMFSQVDSSVERSQGGLGIGLSLVKQLVQLHGGSVEAKSDGLGKGSEFIVRLPLLFDQRLSAEPHMPVDEARVARRVLIVDDNLDAARALALLVEFEGNDTDIATDGVTALGAIEAWRPDVVLLDIGLPKMNGYDVARRVRAHAWGNDIVLVALTGWGQDEDRRTSREAGFDAHIVKPVRPDELAELFGSL
jgi:PAS domain S-box-containing protein